MAISGYSIFKLGSSNFSKQDPLTGQYDKYEVGLYDITNLANKNDLNRLEELYLKFNFKNSFIRLGRQFINTPFINLQDGRMNVTAAESIYTEINEIGKLKLQLGWLWGISPRSTTRWYRIGESIGVYPCGINPDGTKSQYYNNIKSKGIAMLGITKTINKNIKLQGWNMFTENVFNTAMIQTNISIPVKKISSILAAAQIIKQDALNNGGNKDQAKTFFSKASHSLSFGASIGLKNKLWAIFLNYNRITNNGRFLMPREWGREPFFTFLPRERNEGLGDVYAFMIKINYNIFKEKLLTSLAAGYYKLPDVMTHALNKYSLPSYTQVNADLKYNFTKSLNGLDAEILIVNKINCGETHNNKKFIFNKVNMQQYNLILNYHF